MRKAVIVEPEIPENTGFIARLAANFNFDLRIVDPEFNLEEARKTASNAQDKLREAEIFDSVEESVKDLEYVAGTKPGRGVELSSFSPKKNTSVMIGRESSGLTNQELEMCDAVVHIDTGEYSSINQSHAAAILFHSVHSRAEEEGPGRKQLEKLGDLLPETVAETVGEVNPSREKLDKMIGELERRE